MYFSYDDRPEETFPNPLILIILCTMTNNKSVVLFKYQKILTIALNIAKVIEFILIKRVRVINRDINKKYGIHINKKVTH